MNDIPNKQNEPGAIKRLRAQRRFHGTSKRVAAIQAIVAVGAPLCSVLAGLLWPALRPTAALMSLLSAVVDVALLDPWQKKAKRVAARVQERFDCDVLSLPWNQFKAGPVADPEDEEAGSTAYMHGKEDPNLQNWYPPSVGSLPIHLGRILCQRANLRWDGELRRGVAAATTSVVVVVIVAAVAVGLAGNLTMDAFVLRVVAPLAPFVLWSIREAYRQRDAAESADRLKGHFETLWQRAVSGSCDPVACTAESRQFQDEIFERRSTNPAVFDWIYRLRRQALEAQMTAGTEELVREAHNTLERTPR